VGYFNRANRKFMHFPRLAQFLTHIGLYADHPRESRTIWDIFHQGADNAVLDAADVRPGEAEWFHGMVTGVLAARGAKRFVAKLPSHSVRVPWLNAVFPDAIFVQALRDWRAVVSSTMVKRAKDFDGQWFGVQAPGWRDAAGLPPEMGAAWQYRVSHEILEEQAPRYEGRFIQVWYEDLCLDPVPVMKGVAEACGLSWTPEIEAALPGDVRPPSDKWKSVVLPHMVEKIMAEHGEVLSRYEWSGQTAGITTTR